VRITPPRFGGRGPVVANGLGVILSSSSRVGSVRNRSNKRSGPPSRSISTRTASTRVPRRPETSEGGRMSPSDEPIDPFEAHFHRNRFRGRSSGSLSLAGGSPARCVARGLENVISSSGRAAEGVVVPGCRQRGPPASSKGYGRPASPLVRVTANAAPWPAGHRARLLVNRSLRPRLGRRQVLDPAAIRRWSARLPGRSFSPGGSRVHSPAGFQPPREAENWS